MYFASFMKGLADAARPLSSVSLANLSSLAGEELQSFRREWQTLGVERRRLLVLRLSDLAEDSPELDFEEVFRAGLLDPDSEVRKASLLGVWGTEDRTFIRPLLSLLRGDPEPAVRAAAAQALGGFVSLGVSDRLSPRDRSAVEDALLEVAESESQAADVRRRAVESLGLGSGSRLVALIERCYNSSDTKVRASAVYAMGQSCDPRWLPVLLRELRSDEPEVRFDAASACGELGDEGAIPSLIELIEDEDTQVQLAAVAALGHIGGVTAKAALQHCQTHESEQVRDAAEDALEELAFSDDPLTFGFGG